MLGVRLFTIAIIYPYKDEHIPKNLSVHESCWDFTGQLVRQSLRVYLTEQIFTWQKKINKFHSLTNVFITYMYKQQ